MDGLPQSVDSFKALLQMRLNTKRFLRLGEYLEHVVVTQEEESREKQPFLLEVVQHAAVNPFHQHIRLTHTFQQSNLHSSRNFI